MPPPIKGVLETSLYVSDLPRAISFYQDILGLRLIDQFDGGRGAALAAGSSVVLLFRADLCIAKVDFPMHGAVGPGHIAFHIPHNEFSEWRDHLTQNGIHIEKEIPFRDEPPSIYFRDPDGNLIELAVPAIWNL
ncbi:MAG: VOC family protein [Acidobacteria bacterium]|nr:VOC family protein [Acidobacteriota bacterium]